ncbi:NAD(P)-dependent oxidoreductase [Carnobacterium pleistocenium]|uniref:NAD(P)-dependent oxidoreductase n=1 Tax=Carnobacterium pleistocenium TaxID=181073 RepID=UPI0005532E41|nr:NAD(P)-dependent oxidoreductase [Carnobacterium pleistocenium]
MKVAVIAATGRAGTLIAKEAKARGHKVTAIVRNAEKLADKDLKVVEKDFFSLTSEDLKKYDVVVNAFGTGMEQEQAVKHVQFGKILIEALKEAPETRLIVVGGSGSLYVNEKKTLRVMDTPDLPTFFQPTAINQAKNLEDLKEAVGINWTFVSPALDFDATGKRTGSYQAGTDQVIVNSTNQSYISYADFAIAIVDEIEQAAHNNVLYTVVSEAG